MSTDMIWQTSSTSSEQTVRLGELLGSQLKGGEVIELRSDLGGGKTTFFKGLAAGAGSKNTVVSPTFTLNRIYHAKDFEIHHFDFYRLNDPGILADQISETINDPKAVTVVEWADVVDKVLPEDKLVIKFELTARGIEERIVSISYPESKRDIITSVETEWEEVKL